MSFMYCSFDSIGYYYYYYYYYYYDYMQEQTEYRRVDLLLFGHTQYNYFTSSHFTTSRPQSSNSIHLSYFCRCNATYKQFENVHCLHACQQPKKECTKNTSFNC